MAYYYGRGELTCVASSFSPSSSSFCRFVRSGSFSSPFSRALDTDKLKHFKYECDVLIQFGKLHVNLINRLQSRNIVTSVYTF